MFQDIFPSRPVFVHCNACRRFARQRAEEKAGQAVQQLVGENWAYENGDKRGSLGPAQAVLQAGAPRRHPSAAQSVLESQGYVSSQDCGGTSEDGGG